MKNPIRQQIGALQFTAAALRELSGQDSDFVDVGLMHADDHITAAVNELLRVAPIYDGLDIAASDAKEGRAC